MSAESETGSSSAGDARLRYVSDEEPGYTRRRHGKGFSYLDQSGKTIKDKAARKRIKELVIPPAWTDVWISPHANGHIQVTGRDERGRKQYIYHEKWREVRDQAKFDKMLAFGEALPDLRRTLEEHMGHTGLGRERVLATTVRLLETSCIRVGNERYREENGSYGLTTLLDRHAEVTGKSVRLRFKGKGGKAVEVTIEDSKVAKMLRRCQELPGQRLLQYVDGEGNTVEVDSADLNEYLQEHAGSEFTAKDFRTWMGSVHAIARFRELGAAESEAEVKKNIVAAVDYAAGELSNTRAVCRASYIHPLLLELYEKGELLELIDCDRWGRKWLAPDEVSLMKVLRSRE